MCVTADDLRLRKVCSDCFDGGLLKVKVEVARGWNSMIHLNDNDDVIVNVYSDKNLESTEDEIVGGEGLVRKEEEGAGNGEVEHSVSGHQHPGLSMRMMTKLSPMK